MKTGEKVRWVQHKPPGHVLLLSFHPIETSSPILFSPLTATPCFLWSRLAWRGWRKQIAKEPMSRLREYQGKEEWGSKDRARGLAIASDVASSIVEQ